MRSTKLAVTVVVGMAAAACVPGYYHRISDGMRVDQDPKVMAQFEVDKTICMGEVTKVDATSRANAFDRASDRETVLRACMAQKGYIVRQ